MSKILIKTLLIETLKRKSLSRILTNDRLRDVRIYGRVLDLGSGQKRPSYFRFFQIDKDTEIVSADISEKRNPRFRIDLEKSFPIDSNKFDFVLCFNLLEHIFNYRNLLKESYRVLKRGGKFLGSVPFLINVHPDPNDYFRYTRSTLERLLQEAGFRKIIIEPIGYGPFSAAYSFIAFVFPRPIKLFILPLVIVMDSLLVKVKKNFGKNKYPLAYYFKCEK